MSQDLYCKIFINCGEPIEGLYDAINIYLDGEKCGIRTIRTDLLEIDLRANKEYIPNEKDFLYWRYYADIEPCTHVKEDYIDSIRSLLSFFNSKGIQVVAACSFENELECT